MRQDCFFHQLNKIEFLSRNQLQIFLFMWNRLLMVIIDYNIQQEYFQFYNSIQTIMKKGLYIALLICVALLGTMLSAKKCSRGEVYHHEGCKKCYNFRNIAASLTDQQQGSCICASGYEWSKQEVGCLKINNLLRVQQSQFEAQALRQQFENFQTSSRLLTITCDTNRGFIFKNNICVNCKDIEYSSGYAQSQIACFCNSPYIWWTNFQKCGCYNDNSNPLYINSSACIACRQITNSITSSQCIACNGGGFGYGLYGCVNCTSILYGTGAVISISTVGSCTCQQGYKWNFNFGACICDRTQWYAIIGTSCQACSSLTGSLYVSCILCVSPFLFNGYSCISNSLISNYNVVSQSCPANFKINKNPITNQTINCVCSSALGFYTNASFCLSCSTQPPNGVSTSSCINCSLASGFALTTLQCIYCLNTPYSTGAASVSSCICLSNYYWSSVTSRCQCDWTLGYYGPPGSCIYCYSFPNTIYPATSNGCTCLVGYNWNGTQCICDTTNGAFISSSGKCINCNLLAGSLPIIVSGGSCACQRGMTWNSTIQQCSCDYTQNFVMIKGICFDCAALSNTLGQATLSGCQCMPTLIWISSKNICDCPPGFVNMQNYCGNCSLITLPTGATVAGCQTCNYSQGFSLSRGICYACSMQKNSTATANSEGCICTNPTYMGWSSTYGGCYCAMSANYFTSFANGILSCRSCLIVAGGCSSCGRTGSTIYGNNFCTICSTLPNGNGAVVNSLCACNAGFIFNINIYPNQCTCSFIMGGYLANGICKTCSSQNQDGIITSLGCQLCNNSQGFYYINNDTCILCSSLANSNGMATTAGCGCSKGLWDNVLFKCNTISCPSGYVFNSQNQVCICNPISSISSGITFILCSTISNSTGMAYNSTVCVCNPNFTWSANSSGIGSCKSTCNSSTSVIIGNICLNCLTVKFSKGPVLGTNKCACSSVLVWSFINSTGQGACICNNALQIPTSTGYSCVCNPAYAIPYGLTCLDCRRVLYSTNSTINGSCKCLPNFVWNAANQSCLCPISYFIIGEQCTCNLVTSVLVNNLSFNCQNVQFSLGPVIGTSNCMCITPLVWSSSAKSCQCSNSQAIIFISGNTYICVTCNPDIFAYNLSTSLTCNCLSPSLHWNSIEGSCGCNTTSVVYASANYSCISCINSIYAQSKLNESMCSCIDPSFKWTGNFCNCSEGSIIMPNFTCSICPTLVTLNNFTCSCSTSSSPNSIWNDLTETCVACGSTVLNSVIGDYGVACQCVTGYIWDVMTNTCIFNCTSIGCTIHCGNIFNVLIGSKAVAVSSVLVRNLAGGSTISSFYMSVQSNYGSISAMACQCKSGYSWDSLRMRCYSNSLNFQ